MTTQRTNDTLRAKPITLDSIRGRATLTVKETGALLGLGRDATYAAIADGQIPSWRIGRRVLVPVPALLKALGEDGGA